MPRRRHGHRTPLPPPPMPDVIPLSLIPSNSLVEIKYVNLPPGLFMRMSELGIMPGNRVKVILNQFGYVVVEVMGTRFGLNPRVSSNIFVKRIIK